MSFDIELKEAIAEINARLKAGRLGVRIEVTRSSLSLRGTFPPKPESGKTQRHQQRLPLGLKAHPAALVKAEKLAYKIGAQLIGGEFDWEDYLVVPSSRGLVSEAIARFEVEFWQKRQKTRSAMTTFSDSMVYLKRLPPDAQLTSKLLYDEILSTQPDTQTRQKTCVVCGQLAKSAGLDLDFDISQLRGSYSARSVKPHAIPTDGQIVAEYARLRESLGRGRFSPDRSAQILWGYGMLATFGLRLHELFFLELDELRQGGYSVGVTEGKTGARLSYALHKGWIDRFELRSVYPYQPPDKLLPNSRLGDRVSRTLRRYKLPWPCHQLRHAYAYRAIGLGIDISIRSRWLGHTEKTHSETYLSGLKQREYDEIYKSIEWD